MSTHSSILAWEIHWTEEAGGATVHRVTKSPTRLSDYYTNPERASIIAPIFEMEKLRLER